MSGCVVADLQCQVLWCLAPDIQISSSSLSVVVVVVVVGAGTRGNWQPEETGKCNGFTGELRIIISLYGHLIDWIN